MHSFSRKLLSLYLACSVALSPLIPAVAQVSAPVSAQQQNLPELGGVIATIPLNVPLANPSSKRLSAAEDRTDLGPAALRDRSQGLKDAVSRGVGLISGAASEASRNWFDSHHITSELALKAGEGGVRGGSLDLLMPFYNEGKNLLFVQSGIRRADTYTGDYRTTVNLGLGYRRDVEGWLLGGNSFYDLDVTGKNARLGVGLEAWTDFLKLSANGYRPLSNWKTSPDQADYLERPAKGWDLRAEGYLASYPQLGAKVAFEQFYGDDVSLFGADNRQKDPHALSVGFIYNPIPLIGLSVDHRLGQHGIADTSANLGLNYRIGEPLSKQLSGSNVMASRMLENMRYDLVSRNNEIVIDHKKNGGQISLPDVISDTEFQVVTFAIKGAATLKSISWTGTAASFALPYDGSGQGTVQLPAYDDAGVNIYSLQTVGTDKSGRAIISNPMQVSVQSSGVLLTAQPAAILATGADSSTIKVKILGANNQPRAAGVTVNWVTSAGTLSSYSSTTDANGEASVTLMSSKVAAVATVEATYGARKRTVKVDFTAGAAATTSVVASPASILADGTSTSSISAAVKDANGNAVGAGTVVSWTASAGGLTSTTSTTDSHGVATIELTSSTTAQAATVNAAAASATGSATVTFTAGTAQALLVSASEASIEADGASTSTLSAEVKDAQGNLVDAGTTVTWSTTAGNLAAFTSDTNSNGVATVVLTSSSRTEKAIIKATVGTVSDSVNVAFVPGAPETADVTSSEASIVADGLTESTISATIKDVNGNLVGSGVTVAWTARTGTLVSTSSTTDKDGVATTILRSPTRIGSVNVLAVAGAAVGFTVVKFIPGEPASMTFLLSNTAVSADGFSSVTATVSLKDANNNVLDAGTTVNWVTTAGDLSSRSSETDTRGAASVQLTSSTTPGPVTITASTGSISGSSSLTFKAPNNSITLTASSVALAADGTSTSSLTATLLDDKGDPVVGASVAWTTSAGGLSGTATHTTTTTDINGMTTVVFTSGTMAGTAVIRADNAGTNATVNIDLFKP